MYTVRKLTKADVVNVDGTIQPYSKNHRCLMQFEGWAVINGEGAVTLFRGNKQFEVFHNQQDAQNVANSMNRD